MLVSPRDFTQPRSFECRVLASAAELPLARAPGLPQLISCLDQRRALHIRRSAHSSPGWLLGVRWFPETRSSKTRPRSTSQNEWCAGSRPRCGVDARPHRGHGRPVPNQRNQRSRGPMTAQERSRNDWRPRNPGPPRVGDTGIEPVTPTVSMLSPERWLRSLRMDTPDFLNLRRWLSPLAMVLFGCGVAPMWPEPVRRAMHRMDRPRQHPIPGVCHEESLPFHRAGDVLAG